MITRVSVPAEATGAEGVIGDAAGEVPPVEGEHKPTVLEKEAVSLGWIGRERAAVHSAVKLVF